MISATCLTAEDVDDYTAGLLSGEHAERIRKHLEQCDACKQLVQESSEHATLLVQLRDAIEHDEADEQALPEQTIAGYEIIRELSRGGQGVVYEALQKSTKRKVAVKVLLAGAYAARSARRRFEREIELVAQLKNPNIITVFDSGVTPDGRPFCVMDYVRGKPLQKHVRERKLALEETLELFATVCDAVQYAHQRGIIHRDLKPTNIVVDAEGNPKILDFGLAKQMAGPVDTIVSVSQQIIGTVPYMSPEQIGGNPDEVDTCTDVYALGVILYELLTGHYPYSADGPITEVLRRISEAAPTSPRSAWTSGAGVTRRLTRRLRAGECPIDGEVNTILLKALAKERGRRYQSAGELARDVRHYLAGDPIEAKRDSGWYFLRKQLRRYKVAATFGVVFATVVVAGFATSLAFWIRAEAERERLRQASYFKDIGLAQAAYDANQIARMTNLLDTCPDDLRGWEWDRLAWLSDRSTRILSGHERGFRYGFKAGVRSAAFSPDGRRIVSGGWDKTVRIWDATTGREILSPLIGHERTVASVAFSPDGKWIASGSWDKTLKVWDASTGEETLTLPGHEDAVVSVAYGPDGRRIVSGSWDKTLKVWDASTGEQMRSLVGHHEKVMSVAFSPDGKSIVSGSWDRTLKVWDSRTGDETLSLPGHEHAVLSVAFSLDGNLIVSGSWDKTLKIWDAVTGTEVRTLTGHRADVWAVAFSPDCRLIASGGADRTLKVWDAGTGDELLTLRGHEFPVVSVSFSPDQRRILSASEDFTVRVWETNTPVDGPILHGHEDVIELVAYSADGRWIGSGSGDKTVKIWDASTGEEIRNLHGHEHPVTSVAFSPDGGRIVSASADKTVKIWNASTGEEIRTLRGHKRVVKATAFSPDGRWIVTGSEDNTLKVWNASTGEEMRTLRGHQYAVTSAAFSPDGRWIVSGAWDNTARVWDATTGTEILRLLGHEYDVYCVAFSPDGRRIVSASDDTTVRVWEAAPAD